ncbi:MAG: hypothetical protein PHI66_00690 [Candidatus Pacebacteria bacterium]|nr:hypothetical protein [Candidatus Paceibacterota bacterium]
MLKTISKIKEVISKDRREREQMRLLWPLVIVSMLGVFCVWLAGVNSSLHKLGGVGVDITSLPEMPEVVGNWNLDDILSKAEEIGVVGEEEKNLSSWQEAGGAYLDGQDIFGETGDFSFLKFVGVEKKEDSIYLEYGHFYKDLPVLDSYLILIFDERSGEFLRLEDNLKKGIELEIEPRVSLKEAVLLAEKGIGEDGYMYEDGGLAVTEYENAFYLVWDIFFAKEEDMTEYEALIGAKNGGLVSVEKSDILEG